LGPFAWNNFPLYDLYEDSRQQIWVATMGGGLYRYAADGSVLHLTSQDGLPSDFVRCVTEDHEGNLWVGMENGGLCRLKPVTFQSLGFRQGLSSDHVTSMCESTNRSFWIATDGDGLDELLSDGEVHHYGSRQGLMNGHVWAVLEDHQGGVWAGTWDGLYRRSGSGWFADLSDGLTIGRQIFAIYQDRQNRVWVGQQGFSALTQMHGDDRTIVKIPESSPSLDVRAMVQDSVGGFWVGTENDGLYCLRAGRWTRFGGKEGLGSESVWSLLADDDGAVWIGTCGGGFSRLKNGKISTWTTKNGLINDVICQILEDDNNNLWLGSYGGIFRVSKSELASGATNLMIRCIGYDKTDGLPSIQCVGGCQPSGFRSQDGRLWFPTVKGFAAVNPNAVPCNRLPPPVIIESVTVDGIPLMPPANPSGTGVPSGTLKVSPGRQRIEFRYTALSLTNPGKVRFKYRLEGIESDWNDAGAKRIANYSYVPPGHYKFHVIACNNDGVWNNAGDSLAITLSPYFWQTATFLSLAVVAVLGSVAGSVRHVVKRKMQRKIELVERERAIETERRRIANDIHDDLGAGLTEIVILSELAQNPGETYDAVQSDVRNVTDKARALTHSLDEIVWAVNPENDTLDSFVSYACNFAQNYLQSCRIRCRLAVPGRIPNAPLTADVRHNFFMVLKEALNNIVKHAGASEVWIQIAVGSAEFVIVVADNGNGFSIEPRPDGLPGSNGESPGHGLGRNGLANMRKRMQSIGGRVRLESQPGRGTRVELTFHLCN
jgi:signal transduction histidine kinase/streptogramin lyase